MLQYLLKGGSISGHPLTKSQVRSLSYQLLDAVSFCHNRGIVHRNLKPKHLLIIPGNGEDPLDNAQLKLGNILVADIPIFFIISERI
jgi:serine/threonine protein kinase